MRLVSKGEETDCSFTENEITLLNPTIIRIAQKIERLPSEDRLEILAAVFTALRRQHRIDETFDPVEFILGERTEQQYQVAA